MFLLCCVVNYISGLVFAIVSACGLYFRPLRPQLGLRPRYTTLHLTLQHRLHSTALTLRCSVAAR